MITNRNFKWLILLFSASLFAGCTISNSTVMIQPSDTAVPLSGSTLTATIEAIVPTETQTPTVVLTSSLTEAPAQEEVIREETITPNPFITPTANRQSQFPPDYNPLTGMTVVYPENLLRSPLMVKISNFPREIRPQAGLSKADIVFEYYIGASMNRFLALYYGDNAEWAGPIRSGRLVDGQLALNYHSALVYGGADERVNDYIKNPDVVGEKAIDTRTYDQCPPLCGSETHSLDGLYVNTAGMSDDLFNDGFDVRVKPLGLETTSFSDEFSEGDSMENVTELEVIFSEVCRSKWFYDEPTNAYYRWEEEGDGLPSYVPTYDLLTPEKQLTVQNVLILFSNYVVYDATLHDIRIHYADGAMPALFFRNGKMVPGYWSGLAVKEPLNFLTQNGIEYNLAPGKSWIIFVTDDSIFQQVTEDAWRLEFAIP